MRALTASAAALACAVAVGTAQADDPPNSPTAIPPGAKWSQAYIHEADGTTLHADVLRPAGLPDSAKTPVILSIGPYFNHSGQTGVEGTPFDPTASPGPSTRFYDFETGGKLFQRGYTYVMVDLRGFGGSTGCLDWAGPGEQADVKAAVEWAASQPWSTGRVGMYGKSYDAVTGLIAEDLQPRGLAAIVAQEPVYDLYRYLYMNRVRFVNSLATPALYDSIAGTPGTASDTLAYNSNSVNDTSRPGCPAFNYADQQNRDHNAPYWKPRNLIPGAKGKKTPLFMTQGFIENNTKPDGAFEYFNNVDGPKRGWFGQWEHVRGNDHDSTGRLRMGRAGWFDEVMRFYDHYVKGLPLSAAPTDKDPELAVESSDGRWRRETHWPPQDTFYLNTPLNPGSYVDHGSNNGTQPHVGDTTVIAGDGIWTFSRPLDYEARMAGTPHLTVDVDAQPEGNLVGDVYDVDEKGNALLVSRGAFLLPGSGTFSFDLYPNDWVLPKGHRVGVLVTSSNTEWWAHVPTGQQVNVKSASISLGYLSCTRTKTIQGDQSIFLEDYKNNAPFPVDASTIAGATSSKFPLPAKLASGCAPGESGASACPDKRKFRFRVHQPRKGRIVRVAVFINGKRKKVKRGRRVTHVTIKRLPQRKFTVKIVATSSRGQRTISVRRYRGCKKGKPHTRVRGRHRGHGRHHR